LLFSFSLPLFAQPLIYDAPLAGPLLVTGTFGELRSDHFHAGLDFRAQTGTPVMAVADGFVSRIRISGGGYGQAIYIDHPDGHRSVYGHLEVLAPELLDTVRARQYAGEEFRQDLRFDSTAYPVVRGQVIGGVGNRGHSFGAHLHFEMRLIAGDAPVNPLAFGFSVPDTRAPAVRQLRVYELDDHGLEVTTQTVVPTTVRGGGYEVRDTVIVASPRVGLSLKTYDRQNAMPNWNGIYGGSLYADTTLVFDFRFDLIPFEQTEYLNALTDYADWVKNTSWYHRFWALSPRQFLARPRDAKNVGGAGTYNGVLKLRPEKPLPVRMRVLDHAGNASDVALVLVYRPAAGTGAPHRPHQYLLPAGEASIIDKDDLRLELAADALYRDCFFRYARLPDRSSGVLSPTHQLHDHRTPLHGKARLSLRPFAEPGASLRNHVYLGHCDTEGQRHSHGGRWGDDGRFTAAIPSFGDYALYLDTLPPGIVINYFPAELRRAAGFSLLVEDEVSGGRLDYRGTVDGQWILLEYDAKNNKLTYNFADGDFPPGKHRFVLEVQDARGNATSWERRFRR